VAPAAAVSRAAALDLLTANPLQSRSRFGLPVVVLCAAGAAVLAAAVCGIYSRALHGAFLFDDAATVTNNPSIVHLWPLIAHEKDGGPLNPPANRPTSARPIVNFTLAVNYAIGGLDTTTYHAGNIAIHVLAALLLWIIVWRTLELDYFGGRFNGVAGYLGFISALLWALHPVNSESVAYVTQRTESLMGLFYLATIYASLRYWSAPSAAARVAWLIIACAAGTLGMLSKEMMASAIAMVLLFERTFIRGSFVAAIKRSWPLYVGLALSWLPFLGISYFGPHTPVAGFHLGVPAHVWWLTECEVVIRLLKLVIWPWPLLIHYEIMHLGTLGEAWPWVLPVAALIVAAVVLVWKRRPSGFVLVWFFAVLSPTLLIPMPKEELAERRLYVPLAAIIPLVVGGAFLAWQRFSQAISVDKRWTIAGFSLATGLLAAVYGTVTFHRLEAFQTELSIWEQAARYQPRDPLVQVNYGTALAQIGRREKAMQQFEKTLTLDPNHPRAHFNLGNALADKSQFEEAIPHFQKAVAGEPDDFFARFNLGRALLAVGRTEEAIESLRLAVEQRPDFGSAHTNLGIALVAVGKSAEAIDHFQQAIKLEPDAEGYVNLLGAYAMCGRTQEAIGAWEKAVKLARAEKKYELAADLEKRLAGYRAATLHP
jgi:tetratricopeptide (TPR) repeat protein